MKSLQPCESVTIAKPHRASDVLHHLQNHELVASKCEYLEHRLHTSLVTGSQLERDELAPGVAALLEQIGIHRAQPVIVRVLGNLLQQPPLPTEVKIGHSLRSCDLGPIRYGAARDQLLPWRALVAAARARRVQGPRRPGTIERHYLEGVGRIDQGADVWPLDAQSVDVPTMRPMSMEELPLPAELAFTQSAPWIDGLAMVRPDPAGPALMTLFGSFDIDAYGSSVAPSGCVKLEAGQLSAVSPTMGLAFRRTRRLTCPAAPYYVRPLGERSAQRHRCAASDL